MAIPIKIEPLEGYKLFVKYNDGTEGEMDLSNFVEKDEFSSLKDMKEFRRVYIDKKSKDICWNENLSICKDATYKQIYYKALMKRLRIDIDKI